jgi:hypothetical protein
MANRRTYADSQLREAVATSANWSSVMVALGKTPGSGTQAVKAVAARLGLDTSHFADKRSFKPVPRVVLPFNNNARQAGPRGLSIAARWFLDRGYVVSVPLDPTAYDLITESDEGLKRVQVKTTRQRGVNGRYVVRVSRLAHGLSAHRNANGSRKLVPYAPDLIDLFFIVTPELSYIIPIGVTGDRLTLVLDEKYAAFAV